MTPDAIVVAALPYGHGGAAFSHRMLSHRSKDLGVPTYTTCAAPRKCHVLRVRSLLQSCMALANLPRANILLGVGLSTRETLTMKVSTFWNQALLAALHRLPAAEAKAEADEATRIAIAFHQDHATDIVPTNTPRMDVSLKRHPIQLGNVKFARRSMADLPTRGRARERARKKDVSTREKANAP